MTGFRGWGLGGRVQGLRLDGRVKGSSLGFRWQGLRFRVVVAGQTGSDLLVRPSSVPDCLHWRHGQSTRAIKRRLGAWVSRVVQQDTNGRDYWIDRMSRKVYWTRPDGAPEQRAKKEVKGLKIYDLVK